MLLRPRAQGARHVLWPSALYAAQGKSVEARGSQAGLFAAPVYRRRLGAGPDVAQSAPPAERALMALSRRQMRVGLCVVAILIVVVLPLVAVSLTPHSAAHIALAPLAPLAPLGPLPPIGAAGLRVSPEGLPPSLGGAPVSLGSSPDLLGGGREGAARVGVGDSGDRGGRARVQALRGQYAGLNLQESPAPATYCFAVPFVMQDGVPLMAVRVTSQSNLFVCVADTGSMELNLSGSGCARCDRGYGEYQHTPELEAAPSQVLTYGTQRDVVKEVHDELQFHAGGATYPMPVCVTVERTKSLSNFNVFGLQDGRQSDSEGVLGKVFGPDHSLLVRFQDEAGGLVAGVTAAATAAFRRRATLAVPLTWSDMGFFMTKVYFLRVGPARIDTTARLVIWDTGSNLTSLPKATFAKCARGLRARQPFTFCLDGNAEFTVDARNYTWRGTRELMVDDDLQVLGSKAPGYIIMGAYCMQGYQLLFTRDHLYIAPSAAGAIETA